MNDERDPVIDSLLDEVLGGQEPPDLTQRILGAHEALGDLASVEPRVNKVRRRDRQNHSRPSRYAGWAVAGIVLLGGGIFSIWAWDQQNRFLQDNAPPPVPVAHEKSKSEKASSEKSAPTDSLAEQEVTTVRPAWIDRKVIKDHVRERKAELLAQEGESTQEIIHSPEYVRPFQVSGASSDSQVVSFVNKQLADGWQRARVTPTKTVSDYDWLVRTTSTLVGRPPTREERAAFESTRDREALLDHLLRHEDFARTWGKSLTETLLSSASSQDFDRAALQQYLVDSLREDKPFDQLAFELVTAQGDAKNNPAVNFMLAHQSQGRAQVAATDKLCRMFLNAEMQCARCHDHPFDARLTQETYWETAAFLTQMRKVKTPSGWAIVDRDDFGTDGKSIDEADLFYTANRNGSVAYARFPGSDEPAIQSGRVKDVNRRVKLAEAVVDSEQFAASVTEQLWKRVFGTGFIKPSGMSRKGTNPSHRELLDGLAREFRQSGFDVKKSLRWILRSSAFEREERKRTDPLIARQGSDAFSSFMDLRSAPRPELGKSLAAIAANVSKHDPAAILSSIESATVRKGDARRAQRQVNAIHRSGLVDVSSSALFKRLSDHELSDAEAVSHLFYAYVGRAPTNQEQRNGEAILSSQPRTNGLIQLATLLLNSREYLLLN